MVNFCRVCGYTLEEGATTCSACGAAVISEADSAAAAQSAKNMETLGKVSSVLNAIFMVVERLIRLGVGKVSELINKSKAK